MIDSDRYAQKTVSKKGKTIDIYYSGKTHDFGGNVQALMRPDGFPIWVSDVAPGSIHDDLYVRLPTVGPSGSGGDGGPYLRLQSRRVVSLTAAGLKKAVTDFLAGSWAPVSRVFVYATSLPTVNTRLADEIRRQEVRLADQGIEFEVWDAERLSIVMKTRPIVVDDFFGRAWVMQLPTDPA